LRCDDKIEVPVTVKICREKITSTVGHTLRTVVLARVIWILT
jgi:hypothetical protein